MKLGSLLGSDLAQLVRIQHTLIDHCLKPLGLTQMYWVALYNTHQLPPDQSRTQLAKAIGIGQSPLVRTLDQLEGKRLISWQTYTSDRRTKRIKLTGKAEPLITDTEAVINRVYGKVLKGASVGEVNLPVKSITKLEYDIIELQSQD